MLRRLLLLGCLILSPVVARADLLPEASRRLDHRVLVHFELPPGKALVVENTWDMPTLVEPEQPTPIVWKGIDHGMMRLRLIDRADAPPPRPPGGKRPSLVFGDEVAARARDATLRGLPCSRAFAADRLVVPEASPARELRHELRVTLAGDACTSTHTAVFLDARGEPVDPGPESEPDVITAPAAAPAPPPPPAVRVCGCRSDESAPLALSIVLLLSRRRPRRTAAAHRPCIRA